MFVLYLYPRFDCKLNASLFYPHGPSFVSSKLYKYAFMDLQLSDKRQYLKHGAILLKPLGGASLSFGHIYLVFSFNFLYIWLKFCLEHLLNLDFQNYQNEKEKKNLTRIRSQ